MASYVLKQARVNLTGITSTTYNTVTALLTVTAGHLYIIKGLKQTISVGSTGGAITGLGSALTLTDTDGSSNAALSTPLVYLTSAGALATTSAAVLEWAASGANPTATLGLIAQQQVTAALTADNVFGYRSAALKDMHMQAGQVLQYRPYSTSLATPNWAVAISLSAAVYFDISYIDYTL